MSKNQFHTVALQTNYIELTINALDIAGYCFKNLASHLPVNTTPQQINNVISHHNLIKKTLKESLKDTSTLCPCPPETSDTAAIVSTDDLDGGIFSIVQRLKQIREEINQLNGSAFKKSLLTDKQHYQLLDVDMFLADFIARSLPASKGVE